MAGPWPAGDSRPRRHRTRLACQAAALVGCAGSPAELGRATAIGLRVVGVPVPIATTPTGRWLFPVVGLERCIMS
jgi:hypothetical protein